MRLDSATTLTAQCPCPPTLARLARGRLSSTVRLLVLCLADSADRIVRDGKIRTAHTDAADESTPPVGRLVDPNAPPSPAGDDRSSADEEKKLGGTDEITALPAAKPALAPVEDPSKIEGPWASPKNLVRSPPRRRS